MGARSLELSTERNSIITLCDVAGWKLEVADNSERRRLLGVCSSSVSTESEWSLVAGSVLVLSIIKKV